MACEFRSIVPQNYTGLYIVNLNHYTQYVNGNKKNGRILCENTTEVRKLHKIKIYASSRNATLERLNLIQKTLIWYFCNFQRHCEYHSLQTADLIHLYGVLVVHQRLPELLAPRPRQVQVSLLANIFYCYAFIFSLYAAPCKHFLQYKSRSYCTHPHMCFYSICDHEMLEKAGRY